MKLTMLPLLLALATLVYVPSATAGDAPGLTERRVEAPHHGRKMDLAIWYPAASGTKERFAQNPVFMGSEVMRNAPPRGGRYPIILMSHGMGGTYLSLNWLASALAAKGAIVISVNHPNGWFRDRQIDKMFDHWTRVEDLKVALQSVLSDEEFAAVADPQRIYATGFSFGGWTALSIAGVTANVDASFDYCENAGPRAAICTDLKFFGFDVKSANAAKWGASHKIPNVKAVVSLDPGLTWGLTPESVVNVDQSNLMIIGLGNSADRHYATDTTVDGSGFDAVVPNARIEVISPSTHYTAMPICSPEGAKILEAEKDDPVCTDPPGTDRAFVHQRIIALMAEHFKL